MCVDVCDDGVDGTRPLIAFDRLAAVCRRLERDVRTGGARSVHKRADGLCRYRQNSSIISEGEHGAEQRPWGVGGRGRVASVGERTRKEVIIKTRWDRERGHSISSRTCARTFSFNPTGHHLSENFSIRFKASPPRPPLPLCRVRVRVDCSDFYRKPSFDLHAHVRALYTPPPPPFIHRSCPPWSGYVLYNYPRTNLHKWAPGMRRFRRRNTVCVREREETFSRSEIGPRTRDRHRSRYAEKSSVSHRWISSSMARITKLFLNTSKFSNTTSFRGYV